MRSENEDQEQCGDRLTTAKAYQRAGRVVASTFGTPLVVSPAWGLLIDLYVAQFENRETSLSELSARADIPAATTLRYLRHLRDLGFVELVDDLADGRSNAARLTPLGIEKLDSAIDGTTNSNKQLGIGHLRLVK